MILELWQDLQYGTRMMWKAPGFTLIALLALTLGIGANTAIFSVVNAVLLRPLPYVEADRLVFLNEINQKMADVSIAYPNFMDWRNQNHVFEKIGVYNLNSYNLTGTGDAERILTAQASADLFSALRVNAAIGRFFTDDEDKPGGSPVVVLSYGLWQRRFGGQSSTLNQALTLNGKSYTIIGVMPQDFQYPNRVEMWVPAGQLSGEWQHRLNHPGLKAVARLKPGITLEQARADLENIAINLEKQYPDFNAGSRVKIQPLLDTFVRNVRRTLWVLFAAVGFVLLIACANIANLLLARASARQKEMAIRAVMGASRWRIARQLLTENILLALVGGTLGLLLARWGVELILYVSPTAVPRSHEIGLDWRVMVFAFGLAFLTGILFGLVPALQLGSLDVIHTLKETGSGTTTRNWMRSSLVVLEVATTFVLLVGAGLMIRSFYLLQRVNPGFSYAHLTSFSVLLPQKKYASDDQRAQFFQRLLENVRGLPGVEVAAAASGLPLGANSWESPFIVVGQPIAPHNQTPTMTALLVTPDYFHALDIPLKRGRYFNEHDDRSFLAGRDLSRLTKDERRMVGLNAVIIDEEFARRHWPKEDALGRQIKFGTDDSAPGLTVVGIVGHVKMEGLSQESNRVQAYLPFPQLTFDNMTVLVKAAGDPTQIVAAVREQLKSIDSDQPIYNIHTMAEIRAESVAPERLNLTLLSIFASLALVLAIVGLYGVMSYIVMQRTKEIGIRMALGAQPRDVFRMVIGRGMMLTLVGTGFGLVGAFGLTRLMTTMLFDVEPTDPATFAGITALLAATALVACLVPGMRATKVEPLVALRYE